jgi:hypothetical protein
MLKVTGRDIEERNLALEFDHPTGSWQVLGEASEVIKNAMKTEILEAIAELYNMGEVPSTKNIATHIGKDEGNVSRALADFVATGKVVKGVKVGRQQPYYLPRQEDPGK